MTRPPLLLVSLSVMPFFVLIGLLGYFNYVDAAPAVRSCPTPAENFSTLIACEQTMTARAQASPTPSATATPVQTRTPQPTPTRIRINIFWCKPGSVTIERTGGYDVVECESP